MYVSAEQLRFRYNSASGAFFLADSQNGRALVGHGYSGAAGFANKQSEEAKVAKGPIPRGMWRLGAAFRHVRLGEVAIPIHPLEGTNTFGRTAFYIHGDNRAANGTASSGCIILPRDARDFIARSGVRTLEVF